MTYSQYLALRQLAEGRRTSINPATSQDAWLNFIYALAIRSFPAVDSNGALLSLVTEHLDQLAAKVAALLDDATLAVNPATVRQEFARLERLTTTDEALDFDSPPIVHLLELLIAEAVHRRAAAITLVPLEDCVEVAYRIQRAVYCRESLPLARLYPVLARLRMFAESSGEMGITVGQKERRLRVTLHATPLGLAALLEILPDTAALEACQAQAAKLGCPFVRLDEVEVPAGLLKPLPKAFAWKKLVLPLALQENTLTVAMSAPPMSRRLDELRLIFKRSIAAALATEDEILAAIYRHYHPTAAEPRVSATALGLLGCASNPSQRK
jgi:type II secretory ATPase GspE/PulE/Tfp pilus assembly ATPase PilB-like protein